MSIENDNQFPSGNQSPTSISHERLEAARRLLPVVRSAEKFFGGLSKLHVLVAADPTDGLLDVILDLLGLPAEGSGDEEDPFDRDGYHDAVVHAALGGTWYTWDEEEDEEEIKGTGKILARIVKDAEMFRGQGLPDPLAK